MTSQAALDHLVCITGKSMTMLCNFQDLQAERSAVLSEAEGTKKVLLGKHGDSRGCICCAILVMFSISVALERVQLRLYLIFTGIKTAPV